MRSRYRLMYTLDGQPLEASACTLDGAIVLAKAESRGNVATVYVVDCQRPPYLPRGFARAGAWTWFKACHACAGVGFTGKERTECERCGHTGRVVDHG